jgi:hypothetical protein
MGFGHNLACGWGKREEKLSQSEPGEVNPEPRSEDHGGKLLSLSTNVLSRARKNILLQSLI